MIESQRVNIILSHSLPFFPLFSSRLNRSLNMYEKHSTEASPECKFTADFRHHRLLATYFPRIPSNWLSTSRSYVPQGIRLQLASTHDKCDSVASRLKKKNSEPLVAKNQWKTHCTFAFGWTAPHATKMHYDVSQLICSTREIISWYTPMLRSRGLYVT